jgi:hypothetical protein
MWPDKRDYTVRQRVVQLLVPPCTPRWIAHLTLHTFVAGSMHGNFWLCRSEPAREDYVSSLQSILPKVNLAFFSLAGAALRLGAFHSTLLIAAVLFAARVAAVYVGSLIGCNFSGAAASHRQYMWQSMLTQVCACCSLPQDWFACLSCCVVLCCVVDLCSAGPLSSSIA